MIKKITLTFLLFVSISTYSQVGIGTGTPNSDSALDLSSDTKGVLISRVPLVDTKIATPLLSHVAGMIVYNTDAVGSGDTAVSPGFYYNNGTEWIRLEPLPIAVGDVKQSLLAQDHHGWYKLDGRSTSTLSGNAQINAASIGFGANLPDATDKFLKGKSSSESLMTIGGSNSVALSQSNLPNVTFNGTANLGGSHAHDYNDKYHGTPENLNLVTGLLGILGGIVLNILNNDIGDDNVSTATSTSTSNGSHSHTATINTGGSSTPIDKASHMVVNTFVYLGK